MLSLRIALRYLFSHKSHNAVNILSLVSIAGVAIATTAMVIVLSVFNGFSDLTSIKLSLMDPDLLVVPNRGKVIANADSLAMRLAGDDNIALASPMVKEQALAVTPDGQMPVTILGLTADATAHTCLREIMLDGAPLVGYFNEPDQPLYGSPLGVISVGVAVETGLRSGYDTSLQLYTPKRVGRINVANPATAFRGDTIIVAGVYRVEQAEYDNDMVIVPVEVTRRLLDYNNGEASGIQLFLTDGAEASATSRRVRELLDSDYMVLDRQAQQQQAFKMIAIEKWVTLLMLAFILVITSFNVISAIYILRVEKQDNMGVLIAMGATGSMIRNIFAWQGRIITLTGGIIGIIAGSAITLAQQYGGFIKLNAGDMSMLTVESYPVRLEASDLLIVAATVTIVALLCAHISALKK
ncbi:MAG: ABC transporter permease [Clostridiales bacterium]|nr:ABC transporter permease [Clostridiales bacterium]